MKTTSSYFPFLIISLVLYGFIFLYIDQPKSITTLPLNSGEQSIQVQFISQPNELDNLSEENPAPPEEQLTLVEPPVAVEKIQAKKVIKYHAKKPKFSQSEVKINNQALLESIATTGSDSTAHLKAEVFEQQLTSDETITKQTDQLSKTKTQPEELFLPQTGSSVTKKAVVKKTPPENSSSPTSSTKNQGVLQEAIVVSGRKPDYPQRAILRNQQGRVVVKLTVTTKGQPKNPKILTSSGHSLLDNAVLEFIHQELFMPALQGEDKVISEQLFAFRFELN